MGKQIKKIAWGAWLSIAFGIWCILYFFYSLGLEISLYIICPIIFLILLSKLAHKENGKASRIAEVVLDCLGFIMAGIIAILPILIIGLVIIAWVYVAIFVDKDLSIDLSFIIIKSWFVRVCILAIFGMLIYFGSNIYKEAMAERKKRKKKTVDGKL